LCRSKTKRRYVFIIWRRTYNSTSRSNGKDKNTSLEKYGVEYCLQNNEIREQIKRTNVEKYGTEFPTQNEEVKEKVKNTNLQKYGYTNVFQNEDVKLKSKNTKIKKYGVSSLMKRKDFLQNMLIKSKITKFKNSTQICSKQQKYIHSLIGGELNFPVGILSLDIAFPDENIYVEYDGSGHDLHVKMNKMTIEEFNFQELKRYKFLKSQGWKQIKIISRNDYLPSNEILLNLIKQTKEYLQNNHNWVEIDLDNKAIRIKNLIIEYDFGELKRIS
jgi:very-short-patch-repair endonuclease